MRVLVVGAGATGGYFGGRLLEKGVDVTFLVRGRREQQLKKDGLVIESPHGSTVLTPKTIRAGEGDEPFDTVIISAKAYHLHVALKDAEPFVRDYTTIIPILNGMEHLEEMHSFFSRDQIIGGLCFIESTLNEAGHIIQSSDKHEMAFGEWNGRRTDRIKELEEEFSGTAASFRVSENVEKDMWHKYLFITTLSGITSLMRSSVGPVRDTLEGRTYIQQLFEEVRLTMVENGAPIDHDIVEKQLGVLDKMSDSTKSSMLRDIEKGGQIESDHLQGYILLLAERAGIETPLLKLIYQHLKVYEKNLN